MEYGNDRKGTSKPVYSSFPRAFSSRHYNEHGFSRQHVSLVFLMFSFSYSVVQVIENDHVLQSVTLGGA